MLNKNNLILVPLAILLGFFLLDNIWVIYFCAIVLLCVFFLKSNYKKEESSFLIKLFLIALLLRVLVILAIQPYLILYGDKVDIFGDGLPQNLYAYVISETLHRDLTTASSQHVLNNQLFQLLPLTRVYTDYVWVLPRWVGILPHPDTYQVSGYAYLLAALFYFFGFKPVLGTVFNCLLGSLTPLLAYAITKKISNNARVPMVAAVLAGFFPSLFLWSVANEKEMVIIFLNLVIVLLWIKISKERKWFLLPAILLLIWIQRYFRTYYLMPLLGYSSIVISVFGFLWILRKRIILPFFILLLVFLMFFSWLYPPAKIARQVHTGLSNALMHHIFQAIEKGSSYKILPDDYYRKPDLRRVQELTFKRILVLYCKSIFHFFLEPLPSRINNFSKLLSYPQSIFIYFLLFFFMLGTLLAFKKEPLSSLILFLNFFIFSSLVALSEGNIGGLLRHRDIIMPVFLIFTAFGLAACYEKPENNNRI